MLLPRAHWLLSLGAAATALQSPFVAPKFTQNDVKNKVNVAQKESLKFNLGSHAYDEGLFSPLETFDALSESSFTALQHPAFPHYGVRIKKSNFCDGGVKCVLYLSSHQS